MLSCPPWEEVPDGTICQEVEEIEETMFPSIVRKS
jgi:hypothetical protein